jgi:hypothetical protein
MRVAVEALLLDVTGTLLNFKHAIGSTYYSCAVSSRLNHIPDEITLNTAFKQNFLQSWKSYPCYGVHHGVSEKEWWKLLECNRLSVSLSICRVMLAM